MYKLYIVNFSKHIETILSVHIVHLITHPMHTCKLEIYYMYYVYIYMYEIYSYISELSSLNKKLECSIIRNKYETKFGA